MYEPIKYEDGWWITFWSPQQGRRIQNAGPYKTKQLAILDIEVLIKKPFKKNDTTTNKGRLR